MITQQDLEVAAEFCALVDVDDLLEYLGVPSDSTTETVLEALAKKRRYMQAMQSNPKFKDSAKFLIKNYRVIERVLSDPAAHLEAQGHEREEAMLPMLTVALDGVLSDGVLSPEEEAFLRKLAVDMGIRESTYEQILEERARSKGVTVEALRAPSDLLLHGDSTLDALTLDSNDATTRFRAADGHAWWDAAFTRLLLDTIPGGPGEMVDIYCRTALSAMTLLPERRQLTYLGVDRSNSRISEARSAVQHELSEQASQRVALTTGEPDQLPLEDESVDFVLSIRALANQPDTRPIFSEAMRVLRPGGRFIVAEPDGLSETFYFNQNLYEYNVAFHALVSEVDRLQGGAVPQVGRPGLAIGPSLSSRMEAAGFEPISLFVHSSSTIKHRRFQTLLKRLRRYPTALANSVGLNESPLLAAVLYAADSLETRIPGGVIGMCGQTLPLFIAVGIKDL